MKRLSHGGQESEPAKDVLTEKWVVEGAHPPPKEEVWPLVEHSFVEFENLNTLGRFSYNKYNKDIEVGAIIIISKKLILNHTSTLWLERGAVIK